MRTPDGVEGHGQRVRGVVRADGGHHEGAGARARGLGVGAVLGAVSCEGGNGSVLRAALVGAGRARGDGGPGGLTGEAREVGDGRGGGAGVHSLVGRPAHEGVAVALNLVGAGRTRRGLVGKGDRLVGVGLDRVLVGRGVAAVGHDHGAAEVVGHVAVARVAVVDDCVEKGLVVEDQVRGAIARDELLRDGGVALGGVGLAAEGDRDAVRHVLVAGKGRVGAVVVAVGDGAVRAVRPGDLVRGAHGVGVADLRGRGGEQAGRGVALDVAVAVVRVVEAQGIAGAVARDDPALHRVLDVVAGLPDGMELDVLGRGDVARGVGAGGRRERRKGLAGGSGPGRHVLDLLPCTLGVGALEVGDIVAISGVSSLDAVAIHVARAVDRDVGLVGPALQCVTGALDRVGEGHGPVGQGVDGHGLGRGVDQGVAAALEGDVALVGHVVEDQGRALRGVGRARAYDGQVVDRLPARGREEVRAIAGLEGDEGVLVAVLVEVVVAREVGRGDGRAVVVEVGSGRAADGGGVGVGDLVGDAVVGLHAVVGIGGRAGHEQAVGVADQLAVLGDGVAGDVAGNDPALNVVGCVVVGAPDGVEGDIARRHGVVAVLRVIGELVRAGRAVVGAQGRVGRAVLGGAGAVRRRDRPGLLGGDALGRVRGDLPAVDRDLALCSVGPAHEGVARAGRAGGKGDLVLLVGELGLVGIEGQLGGLALDCRVVARNEGDGAAFGLVVEAQDGEGGRVALDVAVGVGDVARLAVLGQNLGAVRGEGVARGVHVGGVGVAVAEGAAVARHDAVGVGGLVGHAEVDDLDGVVGRRGHKRAGGAVALDLALVGILVRDGGEVAVAGDDPALDAVLGVVVGAPDGVEGDVARRHRVGRGAEGVAGIAIVLVLNRCRVKGSVAGVGLAGRGGTDGLPRLGGRGSGLGGQALGRVDGDLLAIGRDLTVLGVGPAHEGVAVAGDIGRQDVARLASVGLERLVGEELDAGGRTRHVEGGRTVHGLVDAAGDEGQRVQVGLPVEDQGRGGGGRAVEAGGVAGDEAVVDRLPVLLLERVAGVVVLEGYPGVRAPVLVQVGVAVERAGLHGVLVVHVVPDARLGLVRVGDLVGDAVVGLDVGGVGNLAGHEQAVRVADQFAVRGQGVAGAVAGHGPALDVVGRVVVGVPDGVEGHGARVGRVVRADGGHDEGAGVRA